MRYTPYGKTTKRSYEFILQLKATTVNIIKKKWEKELGIDIPETTWKELYH